MTAGRKNNATTKHWCTPPFIVEAAKKTLGGAISLDPCSNRWSQVNAETSFALPARDGLKEDWDKFPTIFVNPPYGRDSERKTTIQDWFRKASEANAAGSQVLVLAPVATNTAHWKNYVFPHASAICFLAHPRLRFFLEGTEDKKGAPMACAVIYYGDQPSNFEENFQPLGAVVKL